MLDTENQFKMENINTNTSKHFNILNNEETFLHTNNIKNNINNNICDCIICKLEKDRNLRGIVCLLCDSSLNWSYGSYEFKKGKYCVSTSGGKRENGETLTQCLKRELNEELGIDKVQFLTHNNNYPIFITIRKVIILICVIDYYKISKLIKDKQKNDNLPYHLREVKELKRQYNNQSLKKSFNELIDCNECHLFFKSCVNKFFDKSTCSYPTCNKKLTNKRYSTCKKEHLQKYIKINNLDSNYCLNL